MDPLISINDDMRFISCEIAINRALHTKGHHLETHVGSNRDRKCSPGEQWVERKANHHVRCV